MSGPFIRHAYGRMQKNTGKIEQWDRYWAYGNIHSFSQVAGGNYRGVVADFWRTRFEALADESRILDVATGNGAIALLALETGDRLGRRFEVHGLDMADIEPGRQVKDPSLVESLQRIRFHGRTAAESMPFDDRGFDMVCSQFGVEYSDLSRSLPEIARILKPGGRFAAVMHHRDSVALRATREELAQLDFVLNDVKLYLRARNLLRGMSEEKRSGKGRNGRLSPKLQKKQRALQEAMGRIKRAADDAANSNMLLGPARYVQEIFGALDRVAPGELLGWLDEALRRVTANQRRLLDMTEAARSEADVEDAQARMTAAGFTHVELAVFCQDEGGVLGWQLDAVRDPDADGR